MTEKVRVKPLILSARIFVTMTGINHGFALNQNTEGLGNKLKYP